MSVLFKSVHKTYLEQTRRLLHQNAETAWLEFWTTAFVAEHLIKLGYTVQLGHQIINAEQVMGRPELNQIEKAIERAKYKGASEAILNQMDGYTGVVAILNTGKPGPITALRFDIDANDITEKNHKSHRPFKEGFISENIGAMHACGHDGHTAIGLGVATALMEAKEQLCGVIKLIFQPAEEGVRGAKAMVAAGVVEGVDYFLAGHIGFGLPKGSFTAHTKQFLATTKLDVVFKGKSAHAGAKPEEGTNALLAAAAATLQMYTVTQHSAGLGRLNVGTFNSGSGRNIIADHAVLKIETRGETTEVNQYIVRKAIEIIKGTSVAYGVEYKTSIVGEAITSRSDYELAEEINKIVLNMDSTINLLPEFNLGGSEDATFFMERVKEGGGKAVYMILGTDIVAGHHNEFFDFDEDVLELGLELFYKVVMTLNGL